VLIKAAVRPAATRTERRACWCLTPPSDAPCTNKAGGKSMFEAETWVALAGVIGAVAFMMAG
jgi:hypothetical protein